MVRAEIRNIVPLADHPELEDLRDYDHPKRSLKRRTGVLAAKAWLGPELACFFVGQELAERYVLFFDASNEFSPRFFGTDMRLAEIGTSYELDVFVASRVRPIVDRALPIKSFS